MKRQRECAGCGAGVGLVGRKYCWRCHRRRQAQAARQPCPACGLDRVLAAGTGRCKACSRRCADCGGPVRRLGRDRCGTCHRRRERELAKETCSRCGRPRLLRAETGWCGACSRPTPARQPPRACAQCGQVRRHAGLGLCGRCWQRHPDRPFVKAANLAAQLGDPPAWLCDFAAHAAAGFVPARAAWLVSHLGMLLSDGGPCHPQALLERSRRWGRGRSPGTLARVLEDFFVTRGLAVPPDHAGRLAAGRRQRRIAAVPGPLRPAVVAFTAACLHDRERARRAGTRPRSDATIEGRLSIIRDFAQFLASQQGKTDWAAADVHDVETFLQAQPANRKTRLTALRQFFTWARTRKLILVNPTRGLAAPNSRGFRGPTVALARQRELFRRWTTSPSVHPHEALTGLLALLHAATSTELRGLTIHDIDPAGRAIQLGTRPHPTPLDPASWAALQRCLGHRDQLRTANPHILVTKQTKSTRATASPYYLGHILNPAGVRPRMLRSTRLAELATSHDPKLLSAAFGLRPEGVLPYLADHVDHGRLPEEMPR